MDQILSILQAKILAESKSQNSKKHIIYQWTRRGKELIPHFIFTVFHPYFPSSSHSGFKLSQTIAVYKPNLVYGLTLKASPSEKAYQPFKQNKPPLTKMLLKGIKMMLYSDVQDAWKNTMQTVLRVLQRKNTIINIYNKKALPQNQEIIFSITHYPASSVSSKDFYRHPNSFPRTVICLVSILFESSIKIWIFRTSWLTTEF